MTTRLASNNIFPKVILSEQDSTPSNPDEGEQKLFIDAADHHLKRVNESGTVTDIEAAAATPDLGDLGDVTLTTPSDGDVLTYDSDAGKWINAEPTGGGGGGGGATIYTSAFGSPPGSPSSGDLWLPNNGFFLLRYSSGSAWVPWGPLFRLTDPALAAPTSWVNQGGATVTTTNGGIYLLAPASGSVSVRIRAKSAPSTPYTVTMGFIPAITASGVQSAGLTFRESSSGKLVTFWQFQSGSLSRFEVCQFNSPTSFASAPKLVETWAWRAPIMWLRIADDGADRLYSYSADGQNFIQVYSEARTTFITADEIGFVVNNEVSTQDAGMTVLSWQEA